MSALQEKTSISFAKGLRKISSEPQKSDNPKIIQRLTEIQQSMFALEKEHRAAICKQIVAVCDIARELKVNHYRWSQFIGADWGGLRRPKLGDQKNALRHVLRWVCGPSLSGKQKSSFYYSAVGPLVKQGLKGEDLLKKLKKPGLKMLARKHAEERKQRKAGSEEIVYAFAPKKVGKRWHLPMAVEFDRKPENLFGFEGTCTFTMTGSIEEIIGRDRLRVLAYDITLDSGKA